MTREILLAGIDALRDYPANRAEWSGKIYLVDPRDNRLWDLKFTLRLAAKLAGIELLGWFTSDRYRKDILLLGLSYVQFDQDRQRNLGLRGNDPRELLDDHTLCTPHGDIRNGALVRAVDTPPQPPEDELAYETGIRRSHLRIERNMGNARRIKLALGLTCQTCGFDAKAAFGTDLAMSCIEAHHLRSVADTPESGRQIGLGDFAVLCATCHRLAHRMRRPDDLDAVRRLRGFRPFGPE